MSDAVKPRRPYSSPRRQEQARQTRRAILDAARTLFIERGYAGTTMAAIAERANVSVETVYAAVGGKPVLLQTLIDLAISGGDEPLPALERDYVQRVRAEPDARRKLSLYAAALRSIQERMAPLFLALRAAAPTHPEAHAVWQAIAARRAANMLLFAEELAATGALREGVSTEEVRDVLWTFNAAEFYDLLVTQRGWTPEHFEAWLADAWQRLLLR